MLIWVDFYRLKLSVWMRIYVCNFPKCMCWCFKHNIARNDHGQAIWDHYKISYNFYDKFAPNFLAENF